MNDSWWQSIGAYLYEHASRDLQSIPLQICLIVIALLSVFLLPKLKDKLIVEVWVTGGKPVFADYLSFWPGVYYIPENQYGIYAPYHQAARWCAEDITLCVTSIILLIAGVSWIYSMIAGFLFVLAAILAFPTWKALAVTRLQILVTAEAVHWNNPDGQKHAVPSPGLRMHVQIPHRRAAEEAREHENTMRSRATRKEHAQQSHAAASHKWEADLAAGRIPRSQRDSKPTPPVHLALPPPSPKYQIASELIVRTGPGDRTWLAIAEFANDEHGERANSLLHAINFVVEHCLKEAATGIIPALPRPGGSSSGGQAVQPPNAPYEPFE